MVWLQSAKPSAAPGAPGVVHGVRPAGIKLPNPAEMMRPSAGFALIDWKLPIVWLPTYRTSAATRLLICRCTPKFHCCEYGLWKSGLTFVCERKPGSHNLPQEPVGMRGRSDA